MFTFAEHSQHFKRSEIISKIFPLLFGAWCNYKITLGRNWARILFLVLMIIGFCVILPIYTLGIIIGHKAFSAGVWFVIAGSLSVAGLQIYACVLLFKKESAGFFARKKNVQSPQPENK